MVRGSMSREEEAGQSIVDFIEQCLRLLVGRVTKAGYSGTPNF